MNKMFRGLMIKHQRVQILPVVVSAIFCAGRAVCWCTYCFFSPSIVFKKYDVCHYQARGGLAQGWASDERRCKGLGLAVTGCDAQSDGF